MVGDANEAQGVAFALRCIHNAERCNQRLTVCQSLSLC